MSEIKDYPPYLDYPKSRKRQTNADRIQALSIEEKAKYFRCPRDLDSNFVCLDKSCEECVIKWLKQPAE